MSEFQPSIYQQAIFDNIKEYVSGVQGHSVVKACAGSGKTRTIEEATKLIPLNRTVCFVAFNKHIAETLKARAPKNVQAMTLHSMGLRAITYYNSGKRVNVDAYKVKNILQRIFHIDFMNLNQEQVINYTNIAAKLVSLLKATLCPVEIKSIQYLLDRYNIQTDDEMDISVLTQIVARTMLECRRDLINIDYDDMIWLPIVHNMIVNQFDFLFIDETQDLNKSQLELALKAVKKDGHIIAVGDQNQSIYGFRGADVEAMPQIIERLNAKVFPLSITYRCPKSHVQLAKQFVPEIEAAEWAEEGKVSKISSKELVTYLKPGDLGICRYNAPLVKPCFELIRNGIKATIRGRDIGDGLITLIKKLKANSMKEFNFKLDKWKSREEEKAEARRVSVESINDKYDTLVILAEDCETVPELIKKIQTIFSDETSAVILSSIHKAKGLEANTVFIIQPELMPSKYAQKEWELLQEQNLQYVAVTRAKKNLFLV